MSSTDDAFSKPATASPNRARLRQAEREISRLPYAIATAQHSYPCSICPSSFVTCIDAVLVQGKVDDARSAPD